MTKAELIEMIQDLLPYLKTSRLNAERKPHLEAWLDSLTAPTSEARAVAETRMRETRIVMDYRSSRTPRRMPMRGAR